MTGWATNWKGRTLDEAGIEATPMALLVMSNWMKSTPTDPWTNNPLGMPAVANVNAAVPGTRYAIFQTITDFYLTFAKFITSPKGQAVKSAIISNDSYGPVWRAIADLGWPASATETDYPSRVLDLTTSSYRYSVNATPAADRKTSGTVKASAAVHAAMRSQAQSVHEASAVFNDATKAVQFLIRRHVSRG